MSGFGPGEILVVLLILLVLFGPTLIAFWLGYTLGSKKSGKPNVKTDVVQVSAERMDTEPAAGTTTEEEPVREEPVE